MTVKSHKKDLAREDREARIESHREFQRQTQREQAADAAGEQVGIVFSADNGMTHYENFPDKKVVAVGLKRAAYLTQTFPLNFKRQKLTEALKVGLKMRSLEGAENKMKTGAGAENKSADDGESTVNDTGNVEIIEDVELDSISIVSNPLPNATFPDAEAEAESTTTDDVTTETSTESADDGESTRESDS